MELISCIVIFSQFSNCWASDTAKDILATTTGLEVPTDFLDSTHLESETANGSATELSKPLVVDKIAETFQSILSCIENTLQASCHYGNDSNDISPDAILQASCHCADYSKNTLQNHVFFNPTSPCPATELRNNVVCVDYLFSGLAFANALKSNDSTDITEAYKFLFSKLSEKMNFRWDDTMGTLKTGIRDRFLFTLMLSLGRDAPAENPDSLYFVLNSIHDRALNTMFMNLWKLDKEEKNDLRKKLVVHWLEQQKELCDKLNEYFDMLGGYIIKKLGQLDNSLSFSINIFSEYINPSDHTIEGNMEELAGVKKKIKSIAARHELLDRLFSVMLWLLHIDDGKIDADDGHQQILDKSRLDFIKQNIDHRVYSNRYLCFDCFLNLVGWISTAQVLKDNGQVFPTHLERLYTNCDGNPEMEAVAAQRAYDTFLTSINEKKNIELMNHMEARFELIERLHSCFLGASLAFEKIKNDRELVCATGCWLATVYTIYRSEIARDALQYNFHKTNSSFVAQINKFLDDWKPSDPHIMFYQGK